MTDTAVHTTDHKTKRGSRITSAIVTSLLIKPLAVLTPVLVIPLFIRYLGKDGYGTYETITNLAVWLGLSNLGLGVGLINHLTDCYVRGDRTLAQRYVSTAVVAMVVVAVVLSVLGLPLAFLANWSHLLQISDASLAAKLPLAVYVCFLSVAFGMCASIVNPIYSAYQEIHRSNYWDAVSRIASIGACFALVYTPFGLAGAVIAVCFVPSFVRCLNAVSLVALEKPWLFPRPNLISLSLLRDILRDGLGLFVLLINVALTFQSDRLIVQYILGPSAVADYSVVTRLFMLASGLCSLVTAPLWPAYGEALRRDDSDWALRTLRKSCGFGIAVFLCMGVGMGIAGPKIATMLSHGRVNPPPLLLIAGLTIGGMVRIWAESHSVLLNAAGVIWKQVPLMLAASLFTVIFGMVFTHLWGVTGTSLAFPAAGLLTFSWLYPLMVRQHIVRPHRPAKNFSEA